MKMVGRFLQTVTAAHPGVGAGEAAELLLCPQLPSAPSSEPVKKVGSSPGCVGLVLPRQGRAEPKQEAGASVLSSPGASLLLGLRPGDWTEPHPWPFRPQLEHSGFPASVTA